MEDLEGKLVELIEKFENLTAALAPDALELGLFVARMAAAQEIFIFVLAWAALYWGSARGLPSFAKVDWKAAGPLEAGPTQLIRGIIGLCATAIGFIKGIVEFEIWPFVGVFYPEVWIAKQVLGW